jgi:hypothetical protein
MDVPEEGFANQAECVLHVASMLRQQASEAMIATMSPAAAAVRRAWGHGEPVTRAEFQEAGIFLDGERVPDAESQPIWDVIWCEPNAAMPSQYRLGEERLEFPFGVPLPSGFSVRVWDGLRFPGNRQSLWKVWDARPQER